MNPKLSIIVPCYGVEKYLDRCLNSLVHQTLGDIEIILVDDESPDRVPEMCEEWSKRDSRIRTVHKKNGGLGYARNTGLDYAKGEFVAFIDSDDYIESVAYEDACNEAVLNNADAVLWGVNKEIRLNVWKRNCEREKRTLDRNETIDYLLGILASAPHEKKERLADMAVWHGIYRKKIIDDFQIRFCSERDIVCEDIPFDVDFLTRASRIVVLDKAYSYYCLNGNSLSSTFKEDKFSKFVRLHELLSEKLENLKFAKCRIDRFFIGFVRSYILNLCRTEIKNKNEVIKKVVLDPIWIEMKKRYKPSYLPPYQAIHLWLLYRKKVFLLKIFTYLILFAKRSR